MMKTMLITGSSYGVGAATANLFAERGINVVVMMRNPGNSPDLGGLSNLVVGRLDVEGVASIDRAIKVAQEKFGRIGLAINNAAMVNMGYLKNLNGIGLEKF